jgi:chromosome segregation ATPase
MLITDMMGKVEKDLAAQSRTFQEFAQHCADEAGEKERAIAKSTAAVEDLTAVVTNSQAVIATTESEIQETSDQIAENESELKKAGSLRNDAHVQFVASEKELVDSVSSLSRASTQIKKGMSFAQLPQRTRERVTTALRAIDMVIDASAISQERRAKLEAFLQQQEDSQDGLAEEPAPTSSGIIETIEEMEDKAQETLADVRKSEMKAAHTFAMLKAGTENELRALKKEMAEATQKKQVTSQELAQAQKDIATEKETMAVEGKYLADLKHECQEKAASFEVEMNDGKAELAALTKASDILNKKFNFAQQSSETVQVLFLQTRMKTQAHAKARLPGDETLQGDDDDRRMLAMRYLNQLGRKMKSTALVSLAYRAGSDPFAKIKGLLEEMVAKLLQEAAQEADQKAFCDKEMGESKASLADKTDKIDVLSARIGKAESSVSTLTEEVSSTRSQIVEIDQGMANATQIRQDEKESFAVAVKEFQESADACNMAIQVLREYYDGGDSFIQLKSTTRLRMKARSRGALDLEDSVNGGEGIIGMLEVAESDFAKMVAEAKANENMAVETFEKNVADARVLKASKLAELKGKESEIKGLQASLDNQAQDKEGVTAELQAVNEYLDKLKPQCETKAPSYEEQKARREQEIEGLKNALSILSGTGIPAFLQSNGGNNLRRNLLR